MAQQKLTTYSWEASVEFSCGVVVGKKELLLGKTKATGLGSNNKKSYLSSYGKQSLGIGNVTPSLDSSVQTHVVSHIIVVFYSHNSRHTP